MASKLILEVCIGSLDDARAAIAGGADRLELNMALELGGLTPSLGLLESVKNFTMSPVIAMLRPRAAGFCYSNSEFELMLRDAALLIEHGADGLAFGVLNEHGHVDVARCRHLMRVAGGRQCVFHRAFDVLGDPFEALEAIIELGFDRILTSGQSATAQEGIKRLTELNQRAQGRITIMPAAGIDSTNVADIVQRTGCREVHGSFSKESVDDAGSVSGSVYRCTDSSRVRDVRMRLDRMEI